MPKSKVRCYDHAACYVDMLHASNKLDLLVEMLHAPTDADPLPGLVDEVVELRTRLSVFTRALIHIIQTTGKPIEFTVGDLAAMEDDERGCLKFGLRMMGSADTDQFTMTAIENVHGVTGNFDSSDVVEKGKVN